MPMDVMRESLPVGKVQANNLLTHLSARFYILLAGKYI
jgi:hypothetical protein